MLTTADNEVQIRRRVKIRREASSMQATSDRENERRHRQQKDFLQAVRSNNPTKIRNMLTKIRDTQTTVPLKTLCNALYLAIEKGSLEIAKLLAGPCAKHVDLSDVILVCARHGRVAIADFLYRNVNYLMTKSGHEKNFPLMEALQNEQRDMVIWLLLKNADVHLVDLGGNTILHLSAAVGNGHGIVASILQGVSMTLRNDTQEHAIDLADSEDTIRIFLESAILRSDASFQPSKLTSDCILNTKFKSKSKVDYGRNPFSVKLDHSSCIGEFFWLCVALVGTDDELFDCGEDCEEEDGEMNLTEKYHIYPSYRLRPLERLYFLTVILSEIMNGPSDDPSFQTNILYESVFLVIFEVAAQYLTNQSDHILAQKLFDAFEEIYNIKVKDIGIGSAQQHAPRLYRPMIDLVCKSFFGDLYWRKLEIFRSEDAWRRDLRLHELGPRYFVTSLPSYISAENLVSRLKTICRFAFENIHLEIAIDDPGPGFANIFFHLKTAEDFQSSDLGRRSKALSEHPPWESCLETLTLRSRSELGKFWMSLSAEDKWSIVEMKVHEMGAVITHTAHWEIMRASLTSYINFAWETDLLDIFNNQITIDEKVNETRDIEILITESLESMTVPCKRKNGKGKKYEVDLHILQSIVGIETHFLREFPERASFLPDSDAPSWEQKGRRMLENLVLCEITRKVAMEYLRQREESRMRAEALEQEIEQLNNDEDAEKEKKNARKKKKRRKKKKTKQSLESKPKASGEKLSVEPETEGAATQEVTTVLPPAKEPTDANLEDDAPRDPTQMGERSHQKKADISSEYNHSNPFAMLTNSEKAREGKKASAPKAEKTKKRNRKKNKNKKNRKEAKEKKVCVEPEPLVAEQKPSEISTPTESTPVPAAAAAKPSPPAEPIVYERRFKKGLVMPCPEFDSVMEPHSEIMTMQLIGLPKSHLRLVKALEPNTTALFLFNMAAQMLYGVYEPIMDTNAWCVQGSHGSSYPTQLKFARVETFQPVPRNAVASLIPNSDQPQRLNQSQMLDLVDIFRSRDTSKRKRKKLLPLPNPRPTKSSTANVNKRTWSKAPPTSQPVQNALNEYVTKSATEDYCESERSLESKSPQTPVSSSCSAGPVITEFGLDDASGMSSSVGRASQDSSDPAEDRERVPNLPADFLDEEEALFHGIESVLNDAKSLHVKKQRTSSRPGARTFPDEASTHSSHDLPKRSYSPPKRFKADHAKEEPYLIMSGLTTKALSAPSDLRKMSSESEPSAVEPLHLFGLHNSWDVWGKNPGSGWSSESATKIWESGSAACNDPLSSKLSSWDSGFSTWLPGDVTNAT